MIILFYNVFVQEMIFLGDKVYFNASTKKVTPTAGANTLCGRANEVAAALATEVEVNFSGIVAA